MGSVSLVIRWVLGRSCRMLVFRYAESEGVLFCCCEALCFCFLLVLLFFFFLLITTPRIS